MNLRVGLYGGTFDPPHDGHLAAATLAADTLDLDEVWLVVAARPDGKPAASSFTQRAIWCLQMVAAAGDPRLLVCTEENELDDGRDVVHSADTVTLLTDRYPHQFTWLVGSDVAATIDRWPGIRTLLERAELGVIARPGYPVSVPESVTRWTPVTGTLPELSSTAIRAQRQAAGI